MRLKYLKGKSKTVCWVGTSESTLFDPIGKTTDERGKRLLENPLCKGWFEEVKATPFKCDQCGFEAKSVAGLGGHKRKHKEIST